MESNNNTPNNEINNEKNNKIIFYYQTFSSLKPLVDLKLNNVYVYISSLHFGKDEIGNHYLHLNDSIPESLTELWEDVELAHLAGINILVMLGGAGGAYTDLFNNFQYNYILLYNFLKKYPFIKGIDLDVEEYTDLDNIKMLINKLHTDFGNEFIITMAPVESSMSSDSPGMGGFIYKNLYLSESGKLINWFNVQCYYLFTEDVYKSIIDNGYPEEKITFGMLGDNFTPDTFREAAKEIEKTIEKYPMMNGVCLWEYGDTNIKPITWAETIDNILNKNNFNICLLM